MKHKNFRFVYWGMLLACFVGQVGAVTLTDVYSTGVDDLGNTQLVGDAEIHYSLNGPSGTTVEVVSPNSLWVGAPAGAMWIGPPDGGLVSYPAGTYDFVLTFNLDSTLDASSVVIEGEWASDNDTILLVNGEDTGESIPYGTPGDYSFSRLRTFSLTGDPAAQPAGYSYLFVLGTNTLTFRVTNTAPNPSPIGLLINITLAEAQEPTAATIDNVSLESVLLSELLDATNADNDQAVAYLDPDGDGRVPVLSWETLEESGTIGFEVERRSAKGEWTRVGDGMLPGLVTAPMGGYYRLADPSAKAGVAYQYRLVEKEARGTVRTYGPYLLEMKGE